MAPIRALDALLGQAVWESSATHFASGLCRGEGLLRHLHQGLPRPELGGEPWDSHLPPQIQSFAVGSCDWVCSMGPWLGFGI